MAAKVVKNVEMLSPEASTSEVSNDSSSTLSSNNEDLYSDVITKEMIKEEEKSSLRAAEEEKKLRKEYEQQIEEEQASKKKQLYHLLNRSQFYTDFISKKINAAKEAEKKQQELARKQEERKLKTESKLIKEVNNSSGTKSPAVKGRKRAVKSKLTDYIDEEIIQNVRHAKLNDYDDIFKPLTEVNEVGTRITSVGLEVPENQPLLLEGGVLRPYQMQGLAWLKILFENGVNGILADEMGLGKTVQVIALICYLIEKNVSGPYLIIAPLSTLPNWVMEFEKMAPQIPVVLFHGSKDERPLLYRKLTKKYPVLGHKAAPVIITSYQVPQMEFHILSRLNWRYIIVDEGHVLKNINCQLGRCLRAMRSVNRVLLTGTPLQNNLTELWALLNFLLPDVFDDYAVFSGLFQLEDLESKSSIIDKEEKHNVLSLLHEILTPFLLRRLKADVEIDLPPKKELLVYCPLTQIQMDLYKATVDRSITNLLAPKNSIGVIESNPDGPRPKRKCSSKKRIYYGDVDSDDEFVDNTGSKSEEQEIIADKEDSSYVVKLTMVNPQMQLRKIVNHPYLVQMPILPDKTLRVDEELVNKSGKMLVLDAMLAKLKEKGHKVLIFSFFKIVLDLLEELMYMRGYDFERLDGGCNFEDRKNSIKNFNSDPNKLVFLITTRAGGLGLNLTSADTVIIFDSDWNPQADIQAMDRCHRIGQTRPTVVYRLATKGTVDEKIIDVASRKRKLEKLVIKKGKFRFNMGKTKELTDLEELRQLLESSDHEKTIHSNGFIFSDQELEQLLDRSDMMSNKKIDIENTEAKTSKLFKVLKSDDLKLKDD